MNYKPTANLMRDAADIFRQKGRDLDRMADELEATKDWSIVGKAITTVTCLSNIRLDLLVIRRVRELERELEKNPTPQHGDDT